MLVISRRAGEEIRIGSDIVIVVSAVQGRQVRLAISAPAEIAVARNELDPCASPARNAEEYARKGETTVEDQT